METLPEKRQEREIEYTPVGSADKIKMSTSLVKRYIAQKTRSGAEASEEDCMRFVMLCKVRGLNPWEGDAFLQGYDSKDGPKFTLITAHQAFLKRAEINPQFDGMESGVLVEDQDGNLQEIQGDFYTDSQKLIGGWARVHIKNRKIPVYRRLKLSTFDTGQSRWAKDPGGMIVKCAEGDALRSAFPTSLGGMYMQEEQQSVIDVSEAAAAQPAKRGQKAQVALPKKREEIADAQPVKAESGPPEQSATSEPAINLEAVFTPQGVAFSDIVDVCEFNPALKSKSLGWNKWEDIDQASAAIIAKNLSVTPNGVTWRRE